MDVARSVATGIGTVGIRVAHGFAELLGKSHRIAMELLGEVGTESDTFFTIGKISTTKVLDDFHCVLDFGLFLATIRCDASRK